MSTLHSVPVICWNKFSNHRCWNSRPRRSPQPYQTYSRFKKWLTPTIVPSGSLSVITITGTATLFFIALFACSTTVAPLSVIGIVCVPVVGQRGVLVIWVGVGVRPWGKNSAKPSKSLFINAIMIAAKSHKTLLSVWDVLATSSIPRSVVIATSPMSFIMILRPACIAVRFTTRSALTCMPHKTWPNYFSKRTNNFPTSNSFPTITDYKKPAMSAASPKKTKPKCTKKLRPTVALN